MWDYDLFFTTTICSANHRRLINSKIALVSVIKESLLLLDLHEQTCTTMHGDSYRMHACDLGVYVSLVSLRVTKDTTLIGFLV